MTIGIREKVSLLVVAATALSAFLVARGLAVRSQEVLREHEIVDLGDEAALRGWELSDMVEGLADDLSNLVFSREFHDSVMCEVSPEELRAIAQKTCRRYWGDYLHIDVVHVEDFEETVTSTVIHTSAKLDEKDLWMPPVTYDVAKLLLSPISRVEVEYPAEGHRGKRVRAEPVIWGVAPLNSYTFSIDAPQNFIRVAMSLNLTPSPRHLYVLENESGEQLRRHDEFQDVSVGNDEVFRAFREDPLLQNALEKEEGALDSQPRVQRILKSESIRLKEPYYFLEGVPKANLEYALQFEQDYEFFREFRDSCEEMGRMGGLGSGKELRLMASSRENLEELKRRTVAMLKERYGKEFDGFRWRKTVVCDEILAWAVQVLIGPGENPDRYLIHYAVLEDELASSINYEMNALRRYAFLIAAGAGILAFVMAMYFILPLKRMTVMAQRITESKSESLHEQLPGFVDELDIRRRDEIGDIAKASKRVFEEVIASHEKLEERVADRTSKLRRANCELEQANEQLKSLSHEKDAFVAKVSHDLRQPLTAIFLQVEALKLSDLDEGQMKDVDKILAHATRELTLVNDILEYQKIIMGAEVLRRDRIDVSSLVGELEADYRPKTGERGIDLEVDCEVSGVMTADDRRLRQVLGNLLGNACKFTLSGKVTLGAESRVVNGEEWIEFTVADTGRGMSPEEQSKAFVPFVSNKKDNAEGTGLGLSICKELTTRMGGKIGFVSELGAGTSFSVLLPRVACSEHYEECGEGEEGKAGPEADTAARRSAERIVEHAQRLGSGTGKVLVIDDDPAVRELLKRLLEGDGYEVLTAENGDAGLELARREKPDVITLDVVMPGERDGWEVLKELKNDGETESIPVIMVSIMAEADHGFALDVEDYLVKPVDLDRLSRVVSRVTRSSPQRNILIVDDDVSTRKLLARLLKEAGWESTFAAHGKEALQILEKTRPAAIVLDLMMPEMDGFEFLKRVQRADHLASIPVVVMTGKEPTDEEREFLEERVGMFLKKGEDSGSGQVVRAITQRIRPLAHAVERKGERVGV